MKPIAEIIVEKHVRRMRRRRNGERYFEEKTFLMRYNPTVVFFYSRIFAKIIDVFIFVIIGVTIYITIGRDILDNLELLSIGLLLHLLVSPYLESQNGKTVGKFLFKIQVIDDYGNYPTAFLSYKRNALSLFSSIISLTVLPRDKFPIKSDYHNYICKTWVIPDSEKESALKLIHEK